MCHVMCMNFNSALVPSQSLIALYISDVHTTCQLINWCTNISSMMLWKFDISTVMESKLQFFFFLYSFMMCMCIVKSKSHTLENSQSFWDNKGNRQKTAITNVWVYQLLNMHKYTTKIIICLFYLYGT